MKKVIVIGGGAAGIFAALSAKGADPQAQVIVLEKSAALLSKVRVSGGGRCNVTHSCFDPRTLVQYYPRGGKELLGPFQRFQPKDTIEWFESRGVSLKTEEDGRIFPITDQSETIIQALLKEGSEIGVEIHQRQHIETITKKGHTFHLHLRGGEELTCEKLILATGSSKEGHQWASSLGHSIQEPVPSLFTFNIPNFRLKELSGIAINPVKVELKGASLVQEGPLLITHFGMSGPAVLKLSAWGARYLHQVNYETDVLINWLPHLKEEDIYLLLLEMKKTFPKRKLSSDNPFRFPKSVWKKFCEQTEETALVDLPLKALRELAHRLHADTYHIQGKTTHKEEFVTCGGVTLKEIDFRTLQSKICPGLYFSGEILDIDGVTGGFNFQNAWTTGYIAGISSVS